MEMLVKCSLVLMCCLGAVSPLEADITEALDSFLAGFRLRAVAENRRTVSLRPLVRSYPLLGGLGSASLRCDGGWAADLSTLGRRGTAQAVSLPSGRLLLSAALGLDPLEFGYTICQISLRPLFTVEVELWVSALNSSLSGEVLLDRTAGSSPGGGSGEPCRARLQPSADQLSLHTGPVGQESGLIRLLLDRLLSALLQYFKHYFLGILAQELNVVADEMLQEKLLFCKTSPSRED